MMNEITGVFFLINGVPEPVEKFDEICEKIKFDVYEVIRILNNTPLFSEDHFNRMARSLQLIHKHIPLDLNRFEIQLKQLAAINNFPDGNIKIIVEEQARNLVMHFIPHYYPTETEYRQGVKTGFYHAERTNPNVKTHLTGLRKNVYTYLRESGYFEVFYVDRNGIITEGSRSNVFFVGDGIVYTCPPEKVLLGITRQKVTECLENLNIQLFEKEVSVGEVALFESVFLTGTSPKVLPVSSIDGLKFSCENTIMQAIMEEYDRMIDRYIRSKSSA
ncbi:MAG: aminotransferase class IV [Prolixibacteraceae bacterium]|jgi:branched-chain amino acid aminotransferase|nr:aminotransferase class IV [Prolixibacteraceae bacterium]